VKPLLTISTALLVANCAFAAEPEVTAALVAKSNAALQAGRYDEVGLWGNTDLPNLVSAGQVPELTPQQAFGMLDAAQAGQKDYVVWLTYQTLPGPLSRPEIS
jgi:hypothetical protein